MPFRLSSFNVLRSYIHGLFEEGQWMQANYAANLIYHLMHELKQDTTGQAGF